MGINTALIWRVHTGPMCCGVSRFLGHNTVQVFSLWLSSATLCSQPYYSRVTIEGILPAPVCRCIWISYSCKILFSVANRAAPDRRLQLPEKESYILDLNNSTDNTIKIRVLVSLQRTTPKIPTPEPIAVSVGMMSNFLACERQCHWVKICFDDVRSDIKLLFCFYLPVTAQWCLSWSQTLWEEFFSWLCHPDNALHT